MHEFALADAVLKTALRASREAGIEHVRRISVVVGELQQIETDLFEYSLTQVLPMGNPALEGVEFEVTVEDVRYSCRACSREFGSLDAEPRGADAAEAIHMIPELAHTFLRCPSCNSPDFEIIAGRGIVIERIEGDRTEDDHV